MYRTWYSVRIEKRKYGTIWKTKNVGIYDSEAEVEAAIKKRIENKSL